MKRSILTAVLGVATAVTALGQGHILINNYAVAPYNQIYWADGANAGQALTAAQGIQFQLFYGAGVVGSMAGMTGGQTFTISNDPDSTVYDPGAGHGAGGYYLNLDQIFPWTSGPESFAIKVITPNYSGQSVIWQESANIVSSAFPPLSNENSIGLAVSGVPEPSTLALAGLGAAALMIARRRQ